jgi:hypothetical protein
VGGKEALRGRRFTSDEEVKKAVHTWLREQPTSFFSAGIEKRVNNNNNNNNNNNIYLLQMGCHPVAVITLHVFPNIANKFS